MSSIEEFEPGPTIRVGQTWIAKSSGMVAKVTRLEKIDEQWCSVTLTTSDGAWAKTLPHTRLLAYWSLQ